MKRETHTLEAGRLLCSTIRNFFTRVQMEHPDFQWREGEGFFSRPFYFSGEDDTIRLVARQLCAWERSLKE